MVEIRPLRPLLGSDDRFGPHEAVRARVGWPPPSAAANRPTRSMSSGTGRASRLEGSNSRSIGSRPVPCSETTKSVQSRSANEPTS